MSRCFPFPSPGYEKQARTDDVDVLKKEKQREKKHKKEKKEKERREKEKGEEDRGERKHREKKKDKKEKNRDKKKDKEKGKAKDDPDTSDGTRIPWKTENHRAEKLIFKDDRDKKDVGKVGGHQAEKLSQNCHLPVENRNSLLVGLARKTKEEPKGIGAEKLSHKDERDKEDAGKVGGQQAEKLGQNCHPHVDNRNSVLVELARKTKEEPRGIGADKLIHRVDSDEKYAGKVGGQQAEKLSQNSHPPVENRSSVLVELARKTKEEPRIIRNQLVEKTTGSDWKKDEGMVKFMAKSTGVLAGVEERSTDKRVDDRKADVEGVRNAVQVSGIAMVQNPGAMVRPKVKGIPKPLENNVDRKTDGKEKTKEKEGDDKRGEKRKDRGRDKKSQGKDKDRDKEKKKEEKAKKKNALKNAEPDKEKKKEEKANEKNGSKHAELDKSIQSNKEVHIDTHYANISQLPKDSNISTDAEGNHKKRKTNGVLHANDIRPSKLLRPSSSSHPWTENGRTLEPCQTSIPYKSDKQGGANSQTSMSHVSEKQGEANGQCSFPYISDKQGGVNGQSSTPYISDRQGGANSVKVDSKERKKNGIIEIRSSSVSPAMPTSAVTQTDPLAEANMRPPHPDSKYISEVYMVPKMDELSDHDDQEWLFGCSDTKSKKHKIESLGAEETALVWSEALRIESADICALPYVIPY